VSQSAPGWYQDHDDPQLARWWDGERWTEHTLVLDEQDWSTEPEPPATRFPVEDAGATAVEPVPADGGLGDDVYAPIRDPWGEEAPAAADPATTAWQQAEHDPWATGAATGVAAAAASGWDDDGGYRWPGEDPGPRAGLADRVRDWPTWAKVAVPLAILAVLLLAIALAGALGGDDSPTSTSSSTTSSIASLGDAAQDALEAAGDGPFTTSTFTTLIPLACQAADDNDPALLSDRISLLGYDSANIAKVIAGLKVGTEEYCPDKMDDAPGLLDQVALTAGAGVTTSSSIDVSSTTAPTTPSTRPRTTTTRPRTTTTQPPATTTTTQPPATTTTTTEPATTTTEPPPSSTVP
jgi:hypothetical protein